MNNSVNIPNSKAGEAFRKSLQEEKNMQALADIMNRLETIKLAVEQLAKGMQQGPEIVEVAVNTIDGLAEKAHQQGIDIQQRGDAALKLLDRLTQPQTIEKVNELLDISDQLPTMTADAVNMVDGTIDKARKEGIDIEQRLKAVGGLLNRLSSPAMMQRLDALLDFAEQSDDLLVAGVNALDETMLSLSEKGIDLNKSFENGFQVLTAANTALNETLRENPQSVGGIFSLLRQLNDKDFQKVLAFLTTFGKHFGQHLGK